MENAATVADPSSVKRTLLSVSAPSITVINDGQITTQSSGNVAASDIRLHFDGRLVIDPSRIATTAADGNGGAIRIDGAGTMLLDHSQITTSVSGLVGNGGDIAIHTGALVMNTGFIQANTAGKGARGGNVTIDVPVLIASADRVAVGGAVPLNFDAGAFGLNVIQAAAPTGVSGAVNVNAPTLDISGSLRALSAEVINFGALGKDLCRVSAHSSLTPLGRGGLRPVSSSLIRPEGDTRAIASNDHAAAASPERIQAVSRNRCDN
jgi:hypothetical protein